MYTITTQYSLKWQFKQQPHIQVSTCKTIINTRTGRLIKETTCGGSYGYWIGRTFVLTSKINNHLQKIKHIDVPF